MPVALFHDFPPSEIWQDVKLADSAAGHFHEETGMVQKGDSHLLPERPERCFAQKVAVTFLNHAKKQNRSFVHTPLTNRNTIIESLGVYLPPKAVSTSEVLQGCRTNLAYPLERLTGIRSRRMAGETEFAIDLGQKAIAACLNCSDYDAKDIELLICCNISRYDGPKFEFSFEPSTSVRLKHRLGMERALCFDLSNACAGMFTGILIAHCYLKAGMVRNALVVSGEYITHLTHTAQKEIVGLQDPRMACLTLGDAGAAVVLEQGANGDEGFHDIEMYTLSRYSDLCIGKTTDREHGGAIMLTQSQRIRDAATRASADHVCQMLRKVSWSRNEFYLLPHQTARSAISEAVRQINELSGTQVCDTSNAIYNLEHRGNTASTTHIVAIWDSILNNRLRPGDKVLFAVQASGVTIGTAPYTFDDLPDRLRNSVASREGALGARARSEPMVHRLEPPREAPMRVQIESVGTVGNGHAPRDAVELARIAGEDCLGNSSYDRSQIEVLAHAGVHRNDFVSEPAIAAIVAGRLKVNDAVESSAQRAKTFAFDVINGALGFLNACHTAVAMIRANKYRRIMVVASEIENNAQVLPDRLLGIKETASAVILEPSSDGQCGFGGFLFQSFTQYVDSFRSYIGQQRGKSFLTFTKDPNVENLYIECIFQTMHQLLQQEGLGLSQIKIVFPPQISSSFVDRLAERLNVPRDRCIDLAEEGEDLFTSSLAYAMQHARQCNLVRSGDIGLIVNVGTGIQVGCAVYYF
jgi:3-oxoacyl-[acyl-carrier-protein] synthase III